ncbi:MAG TPA: glycosyltransferase, partial [Solirubrobacteraceae bacterium]|nr:glycosyltransferase [Solirubrobacteraceae bacterium]
LSPADVALLSEPCRVSAGWLTRMHAAAYADTNTASASALADAGTPLALAEEGAPARDLAESARSVTAHTLALRPRLSLIVGPCVYLRRDALELTGGLEPELELTGGLEPELELRGALEVDFARHCLLAGLSHVAADDVLVGHLTPARDAAAEQQGSIAASGALPRALEAARRPRSRLSVTVDARALGATITGTQRHILELVRALSATGALGLRVVVGPDTSLDAIEQLRALPGTEVLPIDEIDERTPRSTIFHRPQQVFELDDLRLALRLGERLVLNQLDLIAYRNPGYHADADAWRRHRRVGRQALGTADRVIVFSDHTRVELLSDELVEDERIRIVPPGLDHPPAGVGRRPAALDRARPGPAGERAGQKGFLFCLGTDFRHKNRLFALRLLAELRERHGWTGSLVLAGTHIPHGSSRELEREYLREHPELHEVVDELGPIGELEKAWLMKHADAVIYPSVYEGFGLVPLEAALNGTPCVFAPQSSLAEMLPPEAAAIVPWDTHASAERVHALLTDSAARSRQIEALVATAERLTWSGAAEATVEIYREAAVAPTREAAALSRDETAREHELVELIAAHDALVARLVGEREHAQRMYDELNAEVGFGLSLIGPHGALPEDLQRALLTLSAKPTLSRRLYGATAHAFRAARAVGRTGRRGADRE